MVLICFGFVLTVLPIFGLRIFLLRPTAILGFKKEHSGKITSLFKNMLERARENSVKEKKVDNELLQKHTRARHKKPHKRSKVDQ